MSPRTFSLPANLENALASLLKEENVLLTDSAQLAEHINRLSDYYITHPLGTTPWSERFTRVAYLAYYLPLNFLRAQAVFQEAQARNFPAFSDEIDTFLDFGSGLGSGSLPWMWAFPERKFYFVERSAEARRLHQKLLQLLGTKAMTYWSAELPFSSAKNDYANHVASVFSYSLTELQTLPKWVLDCRDLIIIEPSSREDGRKLLQIREQLRSKNFSFWAPCIHQLSCPLWLHSKTDWCHDRIHLSPPEWLVSIENHLPFKNNTLTFSYLLASQKEASAVTSQVRLVGDQLHEKGKSKQLICRTDQREFLTWLHRDGEVPELYRGDLIDLPEGILPSKNPQNGELRVPKRS